ncbi:MAG: FxsA family protein [Pseudorhodoplanes sp.]
MARWIAIALLLLPTAEIGIFILSVQALGWQTAFALLVATSVLGTLVLWHAGRVMRARLATLLAERSGAILHAGSEGLLTVIGGVLLVLPGFITDAAGLLLVFPPTRRRIAARLLAGQARPQQQPGVIDLDSDQWRTVEQIQIEKKNARTSR